MFADVWRCHQLFGLVFAAGLFCYLASKSMGRLFAFALFYTMFFAIWIFQHPQSVFPKDLQIRIDATTASAAVTLFAVGMVAFLDIRRAQMLLGALSILVYINSFFVLLYGRGMFHASSMDNAVTVLFIPLYIYVLTSIQAARFVLPAVLIIPLASIIFRHGTTAWAMIAAMVFVQVFFHQRWKLILAASAAVVAIAGAYLYWHIVTVVGYQSYSNMSSGRLANWSLYFNWWRDNANIFFGTGTGTFIWLGPSIANKRTEIFLWMHNEYLQAAFEQGLIGLGLYLAVGLRALKTSFKAPWLFTALVGFAVMCLTQFPFRFFVSQLAVVLILRIIAEMKKGLDPFQTPSHL